MSVSSVAHFELDPTPGPPPTITITLLELVSSLIDAGATDRQVTEAVMDLVRIDRGVCCEDLLA